MNIKSSAVQLNLFLDEENGSEEANLRVERASGSSTEAEGQPNASLELTVAKEKCVSTDAFQVGECEWSAFMRLHGRVPKLGDAKQPWKYRGWLLYYRLLCESHLDIVARWDYWARTRFAGGLLDEPIPILRFEMCGAPECLKTIENWLHLINRLHSHWSPMDTLLDWFLWGFGLSDEPPRIPECLNEELYRAVNIGPLLLKPYDYLGEWIANQTGKWNPHAFFPTPHTVVEFMVQMAMRPGGDNEDLRAKTVMEPALGSGRMLLHASNYSLRLFGVDIDPLMVKTALVNGALYAPWMVRPFPEHYFAEAAASDNDGNLVAADALATG